VAQDGARCEETLGQDSATQAHCASKAECHSNVRIVVLSAITYLRTVSHISQSIVSQIEGTEILFASNGIHISASIRSVTRCSRVAFSFSLRREWESIYGSMALVCPP